MSSVYAKRGKLYARIKGLREPGKWGAKLTRYKPGEEQKAERFAAELQRQIDGRGGLVLRDPTVRAWAALWLVERRRLGLDWKSDRSNLERHVLPMIGDLRLAETRTPALVDLFCRIRTVARSDRDRPPAPRVVWNIYSTTKAMFRDAQLAGRIEQTPCVLDEIQLGPRIDLDPEWRGGQLFTRDEAIALVSDPRIPRDRRQFYAYGLLAGLRPGETSALRWRHWDDDKLPLGQLVVARAYNARADREKGTKTLAVRYVPVHPTLAALSADWRDHGWPAMMGRAPGPDDLIVPLDPAAASRRRVRAGEAFRGSSYAGRMWKLLDMPALGWRYREPYATKATFITLLLDDGADEHIIETRVTHTKKGRTAFSAYNRGLQWAITCREVNKLQLSLPGLATSLLPRGDSSSEMAPETSCSVQSRIATSIRTDHERIVEDGPDRADDSLPVATDVVTSLATTRDALADAVLAGDFKLARKLARAMRRPSIKAV